MAAAVGDYVPGARGAVEVAEAPERTGVADARWWETYGPLLGEVPRAFRLGLDRCWTASRRSRATPGDPRAMSGPDGRRRPGREGWAASRRREPHVKYMMLIYSSPATWEALSEEDRRRMYEGHAALYRELVESGEWVGGNALADPSRSIGVRVRGGERMTTDGPFAEVKEHLAGYDVVDCDSLERAL
ncbi:MAG TPA: YciI family protein, partial [Pseudonocardia sp.]